MRYFKFLLLISFSIILMGIGCNKDRPVRKYYMKQVVKDYMYFKEGTYWDYVDTATGEQRSINVIEDTLYMENQYAGDQQISSKRETFIWSTQSYSYGATHLAGDTLDDEGLQVAVNKFSRSPTSDGITTVMVYPFKKGIRHKPTSVSFHESYDSLVILGKTYHDIVSVRDVSNRTEDGYETITYVAKNYGIIRTDIHIPREIKDDGTIIPAYWKRFLLTNFKIVQ